MTLTVGVWPTKWAGDKYRFRNQYQNTDSWEQSFPLLNKRIDLKALSYLNPEYEGGAIAPVDLETEEPLRVHITMAGGKHNIPDSQRLMLRAITLNHRELEAGCCVLCRASGFNRRDTENLAAGMMFVMSRDGQPIVIKQAYREKVDGKWEMLNKDVEQAGVWMPCICGNKRAGKGETI